MALLRQVADDSLDNNLLKWGVKAHYVHSLMCHLVLAANGLKDKVTAPCAPTVRLRGRPPPLGVGRGPSLCSPAWSERLCAIARRTRTLCGR